MAVAASIYLIVFVVCFIGLVATFLKSESTGPLIIASFAFVSGNCIFSFLAGFLNAFHFAWIGGTNWGPLELFAVTFFGSIAIIGLCRFLRFLYQ